MEQFEILAVIPARGGSKGIPRKNLQLLAGMPLVAHTIEQARTARSIRRVVVSTDDPEIAKTARHYQAEVVWRPAEISGDDASSESALLHTLDALRQSEGYQPDLLVFLQCTSPLTLAVDIDGTVQMLLDDNADSALTVRPFHYYLWQIGADGSAQGINHDKRIRPLRQEREAQYLETGAVYVMRVPGFMAARHRFFGKTALYSIPLERCLEIDEPIDLRIAEVLMQENCRKERSKLLPNPVSALVLDFDGVLTDNRVLVSQDGSEAVVCDRSDGWGINRLKNTGLPILILSTEQNRVVQARADKLGIPCRHGIGDKKSALQAWLDELKLAAANVVYVGNDENDLPCMSLAGCAVAVADAHPSVLASADFVLSNPGGHGAVREICDLIGEACRK